MVGAPMPIPFPTFDSSGLTLFRRNGPPGFLVRLIVVGLDFIVGVGFECSIIVSLGLSLIR